MPDPQAPPQRPGPSRAEIGRVFLKLGLIGFGGPAAHIALMRREVVEQRHWVDDRRFLDLFAASNLIPGPSSTELALIIGLEQGGWPTLLLAGALFILPSALMVLGLAWAYVRFGSVAEPRWILYGIIPVVVGIIADALWQLGHSAIWDRERALGDRLRQIAVAVAAIALYFLGVDVIVILLGGGIVVMAVVLIGRRLDGSAHAAPLGIGAWLAGTATATPTTAASFSLVTLFLTFLKVGAVLFGSGYVLLAFLRADLVQHLHWLTDRQLVDAVAIGQLTPGPVSTTATFVGYVTGRWWGALVATVAIFLPAFIYVPLVHRLLPRARRSIGARAFLDGATAAGLGLMASVTVQLGATAIVDALTAILAAGSFIVLRRFQVNSAWLILVGAGIGVAAKLLA